MDEKLPAFLRVGTFNGTINSIIIYTKMIREIGYHTRANLSNIFTLAAGRSTSCLSCAIVSFFHFNDEFGTKSRKSRNIAGIKVVPFMMCSYPFYM